MRYSDNKEKSGEILRLVIPMMSGHEAAYHPITYTLWYEHVAGINPPLSAVIDKQLSDGNKLDEGLVWDYYCKYITERDEDAAARMSANLRRILDEVMQSAATAGTQAGEFGKSLARYSDRLNDPLDASALGELVRALVAETHEARRSMDALQEKMTANGREVEKLRAELHRVESEALNDPLTGLRNRRGFDRVLDEVMSGAGESSLLLIDIDHFKRINDTYGHLFGDKVIRAVGMAIKANVKGQDTVARIGGEKFAVILPGTALVGASALAEKIRGVVMNGRIRRIDSDELIGNITVSVGVAMHRPEEAAEAFLHRADQALYAAKRGGRNRVMVAETPA
jgi:diguanylate cyclase